MDTWWMKHKVLPSRISQRDKGGECAKRNRKDRKGRVLKKVVGGVKRNQGGLAALTEDEQDG